LARTRDIVVAVIIGGSFLVAIIFFALIVAGLLSTGDGFEIAGFGGNVGVVELSGALTEASGRPVIDDLDRWKDRNSIDAVVIHINSPGGEVAISQEIYDAVQRLKQEKPVVVSMAAVAASGGYYVACAADRIVADPGTLTGSIGVIFQFHTFKDLMDKVGIGTETVKSGELKDVGSYSKKMTRKEALMLRSVVMDTYEQFVEAVAEGRGKDPGDVRRLADGSVFTGLQAYNFGLVDTLGGLYEAVQIAADMAGLEGKPHVIYPHRQKKVGLFDLISSFFHGLSGRVEKAFEGPRLLYLYQ